MSDDPLKMLLAERDATIDRLQAEIRYLRSHVAPEGEIEERVAEWLRARFWTVIPPPRS